MPATSPAVPTLASGDAASTPRTVVIRPAAENVVSTWSAQSAGFDRFVYTADRSDAPACPSMADCDDANSLRSPSP